MPTFHNRAFLRTGSIPERDAKDSKKLYNTALVFSPQGNLVQIHRKLHLFDIDVRWFSTWLSQPFDDFKYTDSGRYYL